MESKSILEIPTPECCAECRICYPEVGGWVCPLEQGVLIEDGYARRTTMDWCELKKVPKEIEIPKELDDIIVRHFNRQNDEFGDIDDYKEDREDKLDYYVHL